MVSQSNIIALFVSGIGCLLLPVVAFILVRRKSKNVTGALFAGVLSFVALQLVIRVPLLQYVLPNMEWFVKLANSQFLLYSLFLGFTAGLFETVGRYLTLKVLIKDKTSYYSGLSHGVGHGGIEAILLVGINTIVYGFYAIMINNGSFAQLIEASAVGPTADVARVQMEALQQALINGTAGTTLLGLLERFLTLFVHIGLSLMVAEGIVKGKGLLYSVYAILIHMALDTSAAYMMLSGVNVYIIEGVVALFAVGMFAYIITSKKRFEKLGKVYPKEKEQEILDSDY